MTIVSNRIFAVLVLIACCWPARGQCEPQWSREFTTGDLDRDVWDLAWFDDGSGPALYVGGAFATAGGAPAPGIARWDGGSWSAVGGGVNGTVRAMTIYDDGSGPALVVAGEFTQAGGLPAPSKVAMWDGASWTALPGSTDGRVDALEVFGRSGGAALYIGGEFTTAGGVAAAGVARWDGAAWSALGDGVRGTVQAMEVFDEGSGPELYIAGDFDAAGGLPARSLAKWSGSVWRPVPLPPHERFPNAIWDLLEWDDGAGPALYATARFEDAGGTGGIARLRAGAWEVLAGSPMSSSFVPLPLGLIEVEGELALAAGAENVIGAWVDGQWQELGAVESASRSLLYVNDGSGPRTYLGGWLTAVAGIGVRHIAVWDGETWSALTGPRGVGGTVYALESSPPRLYAGGAFLSAGSAAAARVAAYEDGAWSAMGAGFTGGTGCWGDPFVLTLHDPNLPQASGLVAGGVIGGAIAQWDESAWLSMGGGFRLTSCTDCCPMVYDSAVFDDGSGPALYASGIFDRGGIARWTGGGWAEVGGGLTGPLWGAGLALTTHDDGSGPALYVGGQIDSAGGVPAVSIARWDGESWSAVGQGLPTFRVWTLAEFEGKLIAAGSTWSDAGEVWQWDGIEWRQMGAEFNYDVRALAVFDDGSGPALYAGGAFTAYDGQPIGGLVKWDGSEWVRAAGGVAGGVYALEIEDYAGTQSLVVGGAFTTVGDGVESQNIARLIGCAGACYADCDGDEQLTFFDFLCFQNEFAGSSAYADCDGSGGHDFFDFLCFQTSFAAGCP